MNLIEQNLKNFKTARISNIPIAGLLSRNATAYKWKASYRCWMLRETVHWRLSDLLEQSYLLHRQGHVLGARILLRSGFETLAILIHMNQLIRQVLSGKLDFHEFGTKTSLLLLGSKDQSTDLQSINIMTILEKCDKSYPGLLSLFANLSESAHPNYEGLCKGYSKNNVTNFETSFANRWVELYGSQHLGVLELCMKTFHHEYSEVWRDLMLKLEKWIESNDKMLEETKKHPAA